MWVDDEDKISQIAVINYEGELGLNDEFGSDQQTKIIVRHKLNS